MKEKELRLALVCYGGVSLAVYMHGVTREILKLVRASAAFQLVPDGDKAAATYAGVNVSPERECDTEAVFFDLLKAINTYVDLRVIIDTITGASAGGINGVLLARAIAHNLSIDDHRRMWLECADTTALMDEDHTPGRWSKLFLMPFFSRFNSGWLDRHVPDLEMRTKLLTFMRSRWFEPPFSGKLMSDMLMDACSSMGVSPETMPSLLPRGIRLELAVSVTDYRGYAQDIPLHDPPMIREREHRHLFRFTATHHAIERHSSELGDANIPGLVFAARATSCFPGAFPAAHIGEIDELVAERGMLWGDRDAFIARNFAPMLAGDINPDNAYFIDGSVLNNKPFAEAVAALRKRSAFRQVDRRIVYIDPDPNTGQIDRPERLPGFFMTLRAALSDIPRNQPVRDDLDSIYQFSERVRHYRDVVRASRPHVDARIKGLLGHETEMSPMPEKLREWRDIASKRAAQESGFAYDGYVQSKVLSVLRQIAQIIIRLAGIQVERRHEQRLQRALENWAREKLIFPVNWLTPEAREGEEKAETEPWLTFLRRFDINYRLRRLYFVIRRLNELYETDPAHPLDPSDSSRLDEFKGSLYEGLELLYERSQQERTDRDHIDVLAGQLAGEEIPDPATLDSFITLLGDLMDLPEADRIVDRLFSLTAGTFLPTVFRQELVGAYVGFAFFDVITFTLNNDREIDEIDSVLVDRISPEDARGIRDTGRAMLKGRDLGRFAGFFSRTVRENDYLWGRLHAADRLVDIVMSSISADMPAGTIDPWDYKVRLFRAIIETERLHLKESDALLASLDEEITKRDARHRENPSR
ncbi:MAG: patatin-like protein [Parvibaculaceae bacterium]|nr:patatin-like protein [Parvibaculaceae bacterium]